MTNSGRWFCQEWGVNNYQYKMQRTCFEIHLKIVEVSYYIFHALCLKIRFYFRKAQIIVMIITMNFKKRVSFFKSKYCKFHYWGVGIMKWHSYTMCLEPLSRFIITGHSKPPPFLPPPSTQTRLRGSLKSIRKAAAFLRLPLSWPLCLNMQCSYCDLFKSRHSHFSSSFHRLLFGVPWKYILTLRCILQQYKKNVYILHQWLLRSCWSKYLSYDVSIIHKTYL